MNEVYRIACMHVARCGNDGILFSELVKNVLVELGMQDTKQDLSQMKLRLYECFENEKECYTIRTTSKTEISNEEISFESNNIAATASTRRIILGIQSYAGEEIPQQGADYEALLAAIASSKHVGMTLLEAGRIAKVSPADASRFCKAALQCGILTKAQSSEVGIAGPASFSETAPGYRSYTPVYWLSRYGPEKEAIIRGECATRTLQDLNSDSDTSISEFEVEAGTSSKNSSRKPLDACAVDGMLDPFVIQFSDVVSLVQKMLRENPSGAVPEQVLKEKLMPYPETKDIAFLKEYRRRRHRVWRRLRGMLLSEIPDIALATMILGGRTDVKTNCLHLVNPDSKKNGNDQENEVGAENSNSERLQIKQEATESEVQNEMIEPFAPLYYQIFRFLKDKSEEGGVVSTDIYKAFESVPLKKLQAMLRQIYDNEKIETVAVGAGRQLVYKIRLRSESDTTRTHNGIDATENQSKTDIANTAENRKAKKSARATKDSDIAVDEVFEEKPAEDPKLSAEPGSSSRLGVENARRTERLRVLMEIIEEQGVIEKFTLRAEFLRRYQKTFKMDTKTYKSLLNELELNGQVLLKEVNSEEWSGEKVPSPTVCLFVHPSVWTEDADELMKRAEVRKMDRKGKPRPEIIQAATDWEFSAIRTQKEIDSVRDYNLTRCCAIGYGLIIGNYSKAQEFHRLLFRMSQEPSTESNFQVEHFKLKELLVNMTLAEFLSVVGYFGDPEHLSIFPVHNDKKLSELDQKHRREMLGSYRSIRSFSVNIEILARLGVLSRNEDHTWKLEFRTRPACVENMRLQKDARQALIEVGSESQIDLYWNTARALYMNALNSKRETKEITPSALTRNRAHWIGSKTLRLSWICLKKIEDALVQRLYEIGSNEQPDVLDMRKLSFHDLCVVWKSLEGNGASIRLSDMFSYFVQRCCQPSPFDQFRAEAGDREPTQVPFKVRDATEPSQYVGPPRRKFLLADVPSEQLVWFATEGILAEASLIAYKKSRDERILAVRKVMNLSWNNIGSRYGLRGSAKLKFKSLLRSPSVGDLITNLIDELADAVQRGERLQEALDGLHVTEKLSVIFDDIQFSAITGVRNDSEPNSVTSKRRARSTKQKFEEQPQRIERSEALNLAHRELVEQTVMAVLGESAESYDPGVGYQYISKLSDKKFKEAITSLLNRDVISRFRGDAFQRTYKISARIQMARLEAEFCSEDAELYDKCIAKMSREAIPCDESADLSRAEFLAILESFACGKVDFIDTPHAHKLDADMDDQLACIVDTGVSCIYKEPRFEDIFDLTEFELQSGFGSSDDFRVQSEQSAELQTCEVQKVGEKRMDSGDTANKFDPKQKRRRVLDDSTVEISARLLVASETHGVAEQKLKEWYQHIVSCGSDGFLVQESSEHELIVEALLDFGLVRSFLSSYGILVVATMYASYILCGSGSNASSFLPWIRLDGSENTQILQSIRFAVLEEIARSPGIPDDVLIPRVSQNLFITSGVARLVAKSLEQDNRIYSQYSTASLVTGLHSSSEAVYASRATPRRYWFVRMDCHRL